MATVDSIISEIVARDATYSALRGDLTELGAKAPSSLELVAKEVLGHTVAVDPETHDGDRGDRRPRSVDDLLGLDGDDASEKGINDDLFEESPLQRVQREDRERRQKEAARVDAFDRSPERQLLRNLGDDD